MSSLLPGLPGGFTNEEASYVYNVEVLGLPVRKAASLAGLEYTRINEPHIMQARETVRRELRGNLNVTKEDVTYGLMQAIDQARVLADPMAQIAGWGALTKLHGLDAPSRIDVNLQTSVTVLKEHVKQLSDLELVKQLGAGNIVDADFYVVKRDEQSNPA